MALVISRQWDSQPQGQVRPTVGALDAVSFASDRWTEVISGGRGTGPAGRFFAANGSNRYARSSANIRLDGPLWCAVWMDRQSGPAVTTVAYCLGSATGTAWFGVRAGPSDGTTLELFLRRVDGGSSIAVGSGSTTFPANAPLCVVAVAPTGASADAYIYVNGVKYATASTSGTLTGAGAAANTQSVGTLYRAGTEVIGTFSPWRFYGAAYGTQIPEGLAAEISANPPRMFAPRRIWVPQAAGAPATFKPAWARNRNSIISGVAR